MKKTKFSNSVNIKIIWLILISVKLTYIVAQNKILFVTSNQDYYGKTKITASNHFEEIEIPASTYKYPLGGGAPILTPASLSSANGLRDVTFVSPNLAYAVGVGGVIYKSTDNGVSFVAQASGTTSDLKEVLFTDQLTGYAFGANSKILKTTDGGINWVTKASPSGTGATINAASNLGNNQIVVAGVGSPNVFNINDQSNDFSSRFYYDALGRLVISQNSKQFNKTIKAYSYTIYDAIGRISQVGEISGSTLPDPFALTTNNGIIDITVYNNWLTQGSKSEVTSTLYDVSATSAICLLAQDNLRKRVSATYLDSDDNLGNGYQYATYYSYDIHGNVKSLINENPNMPTGHTCKKIDYSYDLISGKVLKVTYQKGQADEFNHKYEYDADNRITNALTSKDGFSWEQDAKYFYYKHGPLARVEIGNEKVQGMDYAYTLQGWIKGVNSSNLSKTTDIGKDGAAGLLYNSTIADLNKFISKDAASYSLNYFGNDYAAIDATKNTAATRFDADASSIAPVTNPNNWLYNGNITSMGTTIKNPAMPSIELPQLMVYKYDQLNRISEATAYAGIASNAWNAPASNSFKNEFTYDANGNIEHQNKYDGAGAQIEQLVYKYHTDGLNKKMSNRLYHVNDLIGTTATNEDLEDQGVFTAAPSQGKLLGAINTANNYSYDEIGNLVKDASEGIDMIEWTVYGKISKIIRTAGYFKMVSGSPYYPDNLEFLYDASGNRVAKIVKPRDASGEKPASTWKYTYYERDAQGNVMAVYKKENTFELIEHHVYGSSRLGMQTYTTPDNLTASSEYNTSATTYVQSRYAGNRNYEISNHLGNVLSTISDRKIPVETSVGSGIVDHFEADIISATDYYPFGSPMSNRSFNASSSRYGFNSQEKDDEIASSGSINTAMFWEYDTRLGRRWNIDPKPTIGYSDYSAFLNNPIVYTDPMGDKVKNGYEKSKANAEKNLETKKNILSLASGGLSKTFAQFKVNKAERQLNRIKDLYNQTDALIKDFEKNNNKDFTELDNLKDGGGTTVDAYIRVEDGLYSNRFDNTVGGVEQKKDLDGLTQVQPQAYKTVKTTDGTGAYLPVKSSLYGNNTVVIIVDSDVKNKLRVVSHESGHAIYSVTKMLEYVMWLQLNPNTAPGGHGPGNPSGKEADLREAPFIKK